MSKYLRYIIQNTAPVRIADDETSQHGQTDTLRYFPGSTIRGYVITQLSGSSEFETYKRELFSGKISFLNAYPNINGKESVPSWKGFYEDKTEATGKKKLDNVITGEITPSYKRASLGHFCYPEDNCIRYGDVAVSEDININIGREEAERTVFRSQYIRKNQTFVGYITFRDDVSETLIERIAQTLKGTICLGNRRSAGYGTCVCVEKEIADGVPYGELRTSQGNSDLYMVLLSDTVMRDGNGELTGLCLEDLADRLGCESLQIEKCATSTTDIRGYNRVWQGAVPSAVMYEAGSVFRLIPSSPVNPSKLRMLEASGIGIRRDEGFGQIAFSEEYAAIDCKLGVQQTQVRADENCCTFGKKADIDRDLRIAASGLVRNRMERAIERYVSEQDLKLSGVSASKKGLLMSMCMELKYEPYEAKRQILAFADHDYQKDQNKKIHDGKAKKDALYGYVHQIFESDLFDLLGLEWKDHRVMGVDLEELFSVDEMIRYQLALMIKQLRYENRKEAGHDDGNYIS